MAVGPHGATFYVYLAGGIARFFNSSTGETVILSDGIGAYDAHVSYDAGGVTIKNVTGMVPFPQPTYNLNTAGGARTTINAFQTGSSPQPPTELFRVYPWLTGSKDIAYAVTLHFNTITRVAGAEIPQHLDITRTFRRGDANSSGGVTITDALYIAQYLAGLRGLGETVLMVHPVNAATPRNDSDTAGSLVTIQDALFIAQMLAGLRDASFNFII